MAASYVDSAALAADPTFLSRVTAAMQRRAVAMGAQLVGSGSASGLDKLRLILAQKVLLSPTAYGATFAGAVASDASVDSTVDDPTLAAKVAAAWDLVAGVSL